MNELKTALRSGLAERNTEKMRDNIKKVIMYMTLGIDMSRLFSEMVMASQMGDTVQKKMVYLYLTTYAEQNAELAILAVNTLQKDTKDVDPSVRGLALRSLCSLHLPNIVEYLEPAISAGLSDPSGYVRKTSVMGVLKFNLLTGMPGFVDQLKVMLTTDQDPNVVSNCIVVLKEMEVLPGLLDQALAYSLVNKFHAFSEWSKCLIIDSVLSAYNPSSQDEMFNLFNALDTYLGQSAIPVSFGIFNLFLHWTVDNEELTNQVLGRIKEPLLTLLSSASASIEMQHVILTQISAFCKLYPHMASLISDGWKTFLIAYYDTIETTRVKLSILSQLSCRTEMVNELREYLFNPAVAPHVIRALVRIVLSSSTSDSGLAPQVVSVLIDATAHALSPAMCGIRDIIYKFPENASLIIEDPAFVEDVLARLHKSDSGIEGLEALTWILGEYGSDMEDAPYQLERIHEYAWQPPAEDDEADKTSLKLALIHASTNLFFKRPLETRPLLEKTIYASIEESSNPDVRDAGLLWFRMMTKLGAAQVKGLFSSANRSVVAAPHIDDNVLGDDFTSLM